MPDRWGHGTNEAGLYSQDETFGVAQKYTSEWEGGGEYYNPDKDMWTAYNDPLHPDLPTLGPGLTGDVGGQSIETGQQYSGSLVNEEYQKRSQGDYDWLSTNVPTWGALNPNQQGSVMSLVHNVGQGAFEKSKAFGHLGAGEYDDFMREAFDPEVGFVKASRERTDASGNRMMDANNIPMMEKYIVKGLQNRRGKESTLFSTPWEEMEQVSAGNEKDSFGFGTWFGNSNKREVEEGQGGISNWLGNLFDKG